MFAFLAHSIFPRFRLNGPRSEFANSIHCYSRASPTVPTPAATPAKQGNLAGNWTTHPAGDTTIDLRIGDDETFTWKVTAKGKPRQLSGKWSLANNMLTLAQEGDGGALVGRVAWQADDKWSFRAVGTEPEDQGLFFTH